MVSGDVPITSFFSRKATAADTGSSKKRKARALSSASGLDDPETPYQASGSNVKKDTSNKRHKTLDSAQSTARKTNTAATSRPSNAIASGSSVKRRNQSSFTIHPVKKEKEVDVIDLTDSPRAVRTRPPRRPRPHSPALPHSPSSLQCPPSSAPPSTSSTARRPSSTSPPTSPVDSPQITRRPPRRKFKLPALPLQGRPRSGITDPDESPPGYHEYEEFVPSSQTQLLYSSPKRSSAQSTRRRDSGDLQKARNHLSPDEQQEDGWMVPSSQSQPLLLSPLKRRKKPVSTRRAPGRLQIGETQFVPSSQTQELALFRDPTGPSSSRQRSEKPQSYSSDHSFVPSSQPTLDGIHDFESHAQRSNKPGSSTRYYTSRNTHDQPPSPVHDNDDDEYDTSPKRKEPLRIPQVDSPEAIPGHHSSGSHRHKSSPIIRNDSPEPNAKQDSQESLARKGSPDPFARDHPPAVSPERHAVSLGRYAVSPGRHAITTRDNTQDSDTDTGNAWQDPGSSMDRFQYDEYDRPRTLLSDTQLNWTQPSMCTQPSVLDSPSQRVDPPHRFRTQKYLGGSNALSPTRPHRSSDTYAGSPSRLSLNAGGGSGVQRSPRRSQRTPRRSQRTPRRPQQQSNKAPPVDEGSETESESDDERPLPPRVVGVLSFSGLPAKQSNLPTGQSKSRARSNVSFSNKQDLGPPQSSSTSSKSSFATDRHSARDDGAGHEDDGAGIGDDLDDAEEGGEVHVDEDDVGHSQEEELGAGGGSQEPQGASNSQGGLEQEGPGEEDGDEDPGEGNGDEDPGAEDGDEDEGSTEESSYQGSYDFGSFEVESWETLPDILKNFRDMFN